MAFRLLLLALPALVLGQLRINIHARVEEFFFYPRPSYSGCQTDIITKQDRNAFRIGDRNLKNGVRAYFGRIPDDAFLRSPTPWGDLYKIYNWDQVKRTLDVKSLNILSCVENSFIAESKVFTYNRHSSGRVNIGLVKSVENQFTCYWNMTRKLPISNKIIYDVNLEDFRLRDPVIYKFSTGMGEVVKKSRTVKIGTSPIEVGILEGGVVVSELQAIEVTYTVEIIYAASLAGTVAVNYDETYKCHHYWSLPIKDVISHGRLKNEFIASQHIEITYYTAEKVVIRDGATGMEIFSVPYTPQDE